MAETSLASPTSPLTAVVAGACVTLFVLATCIWAGVGLFLVTSLGIKSAGMALGVGLALFVPWFGPWVFLWRRLIALIGWLPGVSERTRVLVFLPVALVLMAGVSHLYCVLRHC